jgi:ribonuclease HI
LGPGRQTNQRAELSAVLVALRRVKIDRCMTIYTDSQYSIDSVVFWVAHRYQSWRKHNGTQLANVDIIAQIMRIRKQRDTIGVTTDLQWVKGHSNIYGNEMADKLASAGAQ